MPTTGGDTPVTSVTMELLNRVTAGVTKKATLLARLQASFLAYIGIKTTVLEYLCYCRYFLLFASSSC